MVSQEQFTQATDRAAEQREEWLSVFEAACITMAKEPDWKIESITVCSGLTKQTPGELALVRQQALLMARRYGLDTEAELVDHHLAIRVLRASWQGDRTPHACDVSRGHIRVIHALPEGS